MLHRRARSAGAQVIIAGGISIETGHLEALQQLPLVVDHQRAQRQAGSTVQVQFEGITVLVARGERHDHGIAPGDP
ncbi:hypothetical protein D3C75_1118770 [compost metagenome]